MGRILQERRCLIYASSSAGRMSSKAFLHRPPSRGNRWSLLETGHLQSGGFADLQGTVGGGVAAGCPGARSPGPRDEGARGVCKHGSLFSAVRTHTAEAKPCLATGRKAAAPASQSPPASRHLSSLPHPVRKAKEEWMFQLSSDTNTAWVWYLMPKGKGNLCPLPTIHTPSITSFFFRRF